METVLFQNYEEMSDGLAEEMLRVIREKPEAVIVIATGHSPQLGYQKAVAKIRGEKIDVSRLTLVKLDEWLGLTPEDPATCEYFLQTELIRPLGIREERYIHFAADAEDVEAECERFQAAYDALPAVDLVILGIGMNGHVGLNEPADALQPHFHSIGLDAVTKTHAMLTETDRTVSAGVTMGMRDIFRGEEILVLADGEKKRDGLETLIDGKITTKLPVSVLSLHANLKCYINRESFPDMF